MNLGLLGKNISYSFSQKYFNDKFKLLGLKDYSYKIFDIQDKDSLKQLFDIPNLNGFNITIPYKQDIISFLDDLSPEAKEIGAVNTVKIIEGKKIGYNTDAIGFKDSLYPLLEFHHTSALILGSGGASKAVAFALKELNIDFKIISRTSKNNYSILNKNLIDSHPIIINTTPLGTFPNIENIAPFPTEFLTSKHLVYDLIYNPEETKLLKLAKIRGAKTKNGLEMLHLQAEAAWNIWNSPI